MSNFDNIQKTAFSNVQHTFGDAVVWLPAAGGDSVSTLGLFKSPDEMKQVGDAEKYNYYPGKYSVEYYRDQLIGLKDSVDGGETEKVTILETEYYIKKINPSHDGKTFIAILDLVID